MNPLYKYSDEKIVQVLFHLATTDSAQGLREMIRCIDPAFFDLVGKWKGRERTPLMVASSHGSSGFVTVLLSLCKVDVNRSCGYEMVTALHCAASSRSPKSNVIVYLLLNAGADPDKANLIGLLPRDIIPAPPQHPLAAGASRAVVNSLRNMLTMDTSPVSRARDELFLQAYKVYECTEGCQFFNQRQGCAFFHRGIGDRRRNPRQHGYAMKHCRNEGDVCPNGDNCWFSHGVNETRFHPNRFKITLCNDGAACVDMACSRAHSQRERKLINSGPPLSIPVMELNEYEQWLFLNAARFTKYFMRRFPANFDRNEVHEKPQHLELESYLAEINLLNLTLN